MTNESINVKNITWAEEKANFFKLNKVGAMVEGVYVNRQVNDNRLKAGSKQVIYTLVQDNGEEVYIGGRSGNPQIISGLERAAFGERVRVRFAKIIPSTKPGYDDTKVVA